MDRLRVLTLNIWNRQGPWEHRRALIRRGIAALDPHFVGLQEVLHHDDDGPDQARQIADGLDYHVAYDSAWHIGGGLHFGNAVLSRFPITRTLRRALPVDVPGHPDEEPRALLAIEVEAPCGRVPLFVTHLSWKLHQASLRMRQVRVIAEEVASFAPAAGFPPILLGDFNAEPDADEIRYLKGLHVHEGTSVYFTDAFGAAGEGPGYTFARRNPFALLAHEPNRRLDYVFVRGPDRSSRGEVLSARVVLDEPEAGVFPADHVGVLAEIRAVKEVPLL